MSLLRLFTRLLVCYAAKVRTIFGISKYFSIFFIFMVISSNLISS